MEQPGGYSLYQQRRQRLLADALRACGDYTDEQVTHACAMESSSHEQIWRSEHRTLSTNERVRRMLAHLEASLPDNAVADLTFAYEEGILERPPVLIEGAREAVERLSARYRLGIISDVGFSPGRMLKRMLADNGLLQKFASLVFSDEAGRAKPHLEVFRRTAAQLGADLHEIVHIGDLEFTDIIGAKQAGCHAIRFTRVTPMGEGESTIADCVTDDWANVPRLIERLNQSLVTGH